MTTDQLRRARIALGELHDIVNHLDEEHPLYVDRSLDRLEELAGVRSLNRKRTT